MFNKNYEVSLGKIALIPAVFFLTQLVVDIICAQVVDKIGYRKCIITSCLCSAAGLVLLAFLPDIFADPFVGIIISVVVYAIGSGLIEVLGSPIVEACPFDHKEAVMILLIPVITKKNSQHFPAYSQPASSIAALIAASSTSFEVSIATVPNKAADIFEIDSILTNLGFHSVYHECANEKLGYESRNTFYMHFKHDNPFFLDYTYSKLPVKNYYFIENPKEKFSDHIGQVIEI